VDHLLVEDCAVVGVFSKKQQTELPRAYVVIKGKAPSEATAQDAQEIAKWLEPKLTNYKRLRGGINFLSAIPKSPSGKILRRILKEQAKTEYTETDEPVPGLRAKL